MQKRSQNTFATTIGIAVCAVIFTPVALYVFGYFTHVTAVVAVSTVQAAEISNESTFVISPTQDGETGDTDDDTASTGAQAPTEDRESPDFNSIQIVVNKKNPLPSTFIPRDLQYIDTQNQLRAEAATLLQKLITAAKHDKVSLTVISSYRSYSKQVSVYNGWVKRDGQITADTYSARPGYSEHQTGLAVDLGDANNACDLEACFANTTAGQWLAKHAHEYGFIIRFPHDKTASTGYEYEPWHIRYVGTDLAKTIHDTQQSMEEYFGLTNTSSY